MADRLSLEEMRVLMRQAEEEVANDSEPHISFSTRRLDMDECIALHEWLLGLPHIIWTKDETNQAFLDLLESRQAEIVLPAHMQRELMYAKLSWA